MKANSYMLWLDTSKRTLLEKVKDAVDYHIKKYGSTPTVCRVNPEEFSKVESMRVIPDKSVLKSHMLLGVE